MRPHDTLDVSIRGTRSATRREGVALASLSLRARAPLSVDIATNSQDSAARMANTLMPFAIVCRQLRSAISSPSGWDSVDESAVDTLFATLSMDDPATCGHVDQILSLLKNLRRHSLATSEQQRLEQLLKLQEARCRQEEAKCNPSLVLLIVMALLWLAVLLGYSWLLVEIFDSTADHKGVRIAAA